MKSFKTKLDLNNRQRTLMAKHAGVARHAWNWGLATCKETYEAEGKLPSAIDLHKRLVAEVKSQNPWYYEVSKCSPQEALRNLNKAFKRVSQVKGTGFPKFKKKDIKDSFYLEGSIKISGYWVKLPRIGWVKSHEELPPVNPQNVTISKRAGDWYISFKIDVEPEATPKVRERIGVDLGIKTLATLSDGKTYPNPKAYRHAQKKLAKLQKELNRRQKGGKNREKTKLKLAKVHRCIADIRSDHLHQLTTYLAKNHGEVKIEDLNVSGMLKNHKLAGAIADGGFYEFRRQLEYKCEWYGSKLTLIDPWYPSSQICSNCGHRQKMPLHKRQYDCPNCHLSIDRDLNASINLENADSSAV
ncbi:transposase [Oscillatoria sp. HE19RPO]|uniref:RNA-guided endonuclease InsQ/TnpB family protein n=1 Tax=Oscillatoria sp. HE19RPO TaxID=2954806 RepID=UPI0020C59844|nr:transposase [Oscillatoria sp. HE19RPO]